MNKFFSKLGIWEYCFVGFCEMLTSAIAPPYLRHSSAPGAEDGGCKGGCGASLVEESRSTIIDTDVTCRSATSLPPRSQ